MTTVQSVGSALSFMSEYSAAVAVRKVVVADVLGLLDLVKTSKISRISHSSFFIDFRQNVVS